MVLLNDRLTLLRAPGGDGASFEDMVDLYAATLCFELCPRPNTLIDDILMSMFHMPFSLAGLLYIRHRLPSHDIITTTWVEWYLEERMHFPASGDSEIRAIEQYRYYGGDFNLYALFGKVLHERRERAREQARRAKTLSAESNRAAPTLSKVTLTPSGLLHGAAHPKHPTNVQSQRLLEHLLQTPGSLIRLKSVCCEQGRRSAWLPGSYSW